MHFGPHDLTPAGAVPTTRFHPMLVKDDINLEGVSIMGKYVLGWLLGVPVIVLVIVYLFFN